MQTNNRHDIRSLIRATRQFRVAISAWLVRNIRQNCRSVIREHKFNSKAAYSGSIRLHEGAKQREGIFEAKVPQVGVCQISFLNNYTYTHILLTVIRIYC